MDSTDYTKAKHEVIADRIRQRLEILNLTPRAASLRAMLDETYLKKFFARPLAIPKADALDRLAFALETTSEWLENRQSGIPLAYQVMKEPATNGTGKATDNGEGTAAELISPSIIAALVNPLPPITGELPPAVLRGDVRGANIEFPAIASLRSDVPVYGTAAGSLLSGAFQFEGGVIDYVRRPPGLDGLKTVYALFIEGASMAPEHNPGDLRFVNTAKPPRAGDSVIVQIRNHEKDRVEAFIGHYQKKSATELYLGKLNPASTVRFKLEYVIAVHKVLTMNEMFGV